ncbi:hypothetical protein ACIPL1_28750 [Pseudomonas sp. NPDC090202]|uniref:hypothetical protein n=1 Tax=unclassified Pseudomonas TaxID=196821 RepID=UPI0037FA3067
MPHIKYFGKHRMAASKGSVRRLGNGPPIHGETVSSDAQSGYATSALWPGSDGGKSVSAGGSFLLSLLNLSDDH